jgi:hypothetical protein
MPLEYWPVQFSVAPGSVCLNIQNESKVHCIWQLDLERRGPNGRFKKPPRKGSLSPLCFQQHVKARLCVIVY